MRRPRDDPQGRLRLVHAMRSPRGLRMKAIADSAGAAANPPNSPWHWRTLLEAPHRLAFFLALVVLVVAGLCWTAVLLDRAGAGLGLAFAISPSLTHSAVMTFGFLPLFFAGFLFTAGPKWLGVTGPSARQIMPSLLLYAGGWALWLLAGHADA